MKFNKIYIITDASIPIGFAPTNRILSYAKGFKKNGVDCEIIIFRKAGKNTKNSNNKGDYQGINFQYLYKDIIKSSCFFKRRWDNFIGLIRLFLFAIKSIDKDVVVIYYSSFTRYALLLKIAKVFKRFLLLKEESEHPSVRLKSKNIVSVLFFPKFHYQLFDGVLVMTKKLKSTLKEIVVKTPLAIIPMTVDIERFDRSIISNDTLRFITYIGSLNNKKDGVLLLIDAFIKYKKENQDRISKLKICGYASNIDEKQELLNRIEKYGLESEIVFKENVSNIEIPNVLLNSKALILPRPKSKQAENGFPTKLGEYLASAIPVIVTKVGEIPNYLTHKKNAYLIEPDDINEIKKGLEYVLYNSKQSHRMGQEGRKIALQYFNNIKQTKKIIKFIEGF